MLAPTRDTLRISLIASGWLALGLFGARTVAFYLPRSVAGALTEASYFAAIWTIVTALGVLVCGWWLEEPRKLLGLTGPLWRPMRTAALLAPVLLVVSLYVAWKVALPAIQGELLTRGRQAVRATVSSSNLAARQANLGTLLLWTIVVTPLAEELLFRGALWSALAGLLSKRTLATLATAALFAWLHVEGSGGVARLAFVQTLLLGLALGTARQASQSLAAPVVLHAGFNTLTLAQKHGWFGKEYWPLPLPIPLRLWLLALAAGSLAVGLWLTGRRRPEPWKALAQEDEEQTVQATETAQAAETD